MTCSLKITKLIEVSHINSVLCNFSFLTSSSSPSCLFSSTALILTESLCSSASPRSRSEPGSSGQCCGRDPLPSAGVELPDGVWLWAEGRVSGSSVHHVWRVQGGGGGGHGEHEQGRRLTHVSCWDDAAARLLIPRCLVYSGSSHAAHESRCEDGRRLPAGLHGVRWSDGCFPSLPHGHHG